MGLRRLKRAFNVQRPACPQVDAGQWGRTRLPDDGARGLQLERTATQAALAQPGVGHGQVAADLQRVGAGGAGAQHRRTGRLEIEQAVRRSANVQAGTGLHQTGRGGGDLHRRRIAIPPELVTSTQPVVEVADRTDQHQVAAAERGAHALTSAELPVGRCRGAQSDRDLTCDAAGQQHVAAQHQRCRLAKEGQFAGHLQRQRGRQLRLAAGRHAGLGLHRDAARLGRQRHADVAASAVVAQLARGQVSAQCRSAAAQADLRAVVPRGRQVAHIALQNQGAGTHGQRHRELAAAGDGLGTQAQLRLAVGRQAPAQRQLQLRRGLHTTCGCASAHRQRTGRAHTARHCAQVQAARTAAQAQPASCQIAVDLARRAAQAQAVAIAGAHAQRCAGRPMHQRRACALQAQADRSARIKPAEHRAAKSRRSRGTGGEHHFGRQIEHRARGRRQQRLGGRKQIDARLGQVTRRIGQLERQGPGSTGVIEAPFGGQEGGQLRGSTAQGERLRAAADHHAIARLGRSADSARAAERERQGAGTGQAGTGQAQRRCHAGRHRPLLRQTGQGGRAHHGRFIQGHHGPDRAQAAIGAALCQDLHAAGIAHGELAGGAQVGVEVRGLATDDQRVATVADQRDARARRSGETAAARCGEGQSHCTCASQRIAQQQGHGPAQRLDQALWQVQAQAGRGRARVGHRTTVKRVGRRSQVQRAVACGAHQAAAAQGLHRDLQLGSLTGTGRPLQFPGGRQVGAQRAWRTAQAQRAAAQGAGGNRHACCGCIGRQAAVGHREHHGARVCATAQHIGRQGQMLARRQHSDVAGQVQRGRSGDSGRAVGAKGGQLYSCEADGLDRLGQQLSTVQGSGLKGQDGAARAAVKHQLAWRGQVGAQGLFGSGERERAHAAGRAGGGDAGAQASGRQVASAGGDDHRAGCCAVAQRAVSQRA